MNKKIVVTQNLGLYPDQRERLKRLGEVTFFDDLPVSKEEWEKRCKDADIICTGRFGFFDKVYEMENKFFSLHLVNVRWLDAEKLKSRNITVSYPPGGNREAVAEWVMGMLLILMRKFPQFVGTKNESSEEILEMVPGLAGKQVTILGKGNIGAQVGKACEAFEMKVEYFQRGDDLFQSVKDSDVVINCLSTNESTIGLLDKKFFDSMKKGSYFITFTDQRICDDDALIEAVENGMLAGVAHDAGSSQPGRINDPLYVKLLSHPKILTTPHIAFNSDYAERKVNDMMIDNVEAWLKGKPINLVE